ncbi:hypothetical protein JHK87_047387 [Glycine soja]|nr:hypothetical protein JHK87_047387 [Glycine soja]
MSNILACYQLLELNVISAQDLAQMDRSMQTYAVAWIDPDHKLSTRVDSQDIHVDIVHMLSGDLFPPSTQPQKKYIQIHGYAVYGAPSPKRPSSCPKGILNIGAAIIDSSMKSKPLGYNHDNLIKPSHPVMLELHHTKSDYSSMLSSEAIARKHQAKAKKG